MDIEKYLMLDDQLSRHTEKQIKGLRSSIKTNKPLIIIGNSNGQWAREFFDTFYPKPGGTNEK